MAAIREHPTTKRPSVYWYEPNGRKRQKTFQNKSDAVKFKKITADSWKMTLNEEISPGTYRFVFETLDDKQVVKDLTTEDGKTFEVERQYKKEAVLYGKEVDDFLTIDKQKIFAVAYSALQQVDKNQQVLQKN